MIIDIRERITCDCGNTGKGLETIQTCPIVLECENCGMYICVSCGNIECDDCYVGEGAEH